MCPHPDSTYASDADPDPDSDFLLDADLYADPDPTFHPDADPDPDPSSKKRLKPLKKFYNRLIFDIFWIDICKLMRIRFRIQLINSVTYPDFYLMRIADPGYQSDADPDPQHCSKEH